MKIAVLLLMVVSLTACQDAPQQQAASAAPPSKPQAEVIGRHADAMGGSVFRYRIKVKVGDDNYTLTCTEDENNIAKRDCNWGWNGSSKLSSIDWDVRDCEWELYDPITGKSENPKCVYIGLTVWEVTTSQPSSAVVRPTPSGNSRRGDWQQPSFDLEAHLDHTLANAPFTSGERAQIYQVIEKFSVTEKQKEEPETLMSARVGSIGLAADGSQQILVQGPYAAFCGASGNCPMWIFTVERVGQFRLALETFGNAVILRNTFSHGFRDFATSSHMSAYEQYFSVYRWNGTRYDQVDCYKATSDSNNSSPPVIADCPTSQPSSASAQPTEVKTPKKTIASENEGTFSGGRIWTSLMTANDWNIRQDSDYLYIERVNIPPELKAQGVFIRDELRKSPDGKWRGKGRSLLPCEYQSVLKYCKQEIDFEIDLLSEKRIEGIAMEDDVEKFDCGKCAAHGVKPVPFTWIPK